MFSITMAKRDRRAEIMDAAEKLFTSRRFHEITLDDVVQEARVGKGTVYRYFQDKDDLFFESATRGFDELCELVTHRAASAGAFQQQMLAMCAQIGGFFERRQQWFRMMLSEEARMHWCGVAIRQRWMLKRKKLVAAVAEILSRGVREGLIRSDVPVEFLANFLLAMLRTRSRDLADVPAVERSMDMVVRLFCQGAGARPAQGREDTQS